MIERLAAARRHAATLGDGLKLQPSGVGAELFVNPWLGHPHGETVASAAPGCGLFATRNFKIGELVSLYDGEYLEGGFDEACELDVQTHIAHCQSFYVDGKGLADSRPGAISNQPTRDAPCARNARVAHRKCTR